MSRVRDFKYCRPLGWRLATSASFGQGRVDISRGGSIFRVMYLQAQLTVSSDK